MSRKVSRIAGCRACQFDPNRHHTFHVAILSSPPVAVTLRS